MQLEGIHHVTCITGDARRNVDFYTRVLGLRMVAKTINQDDPFFYHLFYADEHGHPGSDITFFEYPHAKRGRAGAGMIHRIIWRVGSSEAIDFWARRLGAEGITTESRDDRLLFSDLEGLGFELTVNATRDEPLIADHPEIPREVALQGFDGVRAYSVDSELSRALFENVLGAANVANTTWEMRGRQRGGTITYDTASSQRGMSGAGTVHHVAWGATVAEHPLWYERLQKAGIRSTPVIDRYYFHSIYFREPSGVLFEIADYGPGFTRDVPIEQLGSKLILPPGLEQRRAEIEPRLTPLPDPRAGAGGNK